MNRDAGIRCYGIDGPGDETSTAFNTTVGGLAGELGGMTAENRTALDKFDLNPEKRQCSRGGQSSNPSADHENPVVGHPFPLVHPFVCWIAKFI